MAATRTITFPFAPLPVHMPFHASAAKIKVAIGGVGSGKSAALCMEAIRFALAQPGSYMLLTRRTVPDLRRSTEKELFEILPAELEKACRIKRLGGHVESITFPNHSQLLLAGMEDWNKHKSMNLSWIGIDESSEQTRDNFEGILTRLRQSKPLKGAPPLRPGQRMQNQMALASNPAGQDWNWDLFVNPATKRGDSSIHLSTPMDNPFLPPEYVDMLLQMPVPYIRRFVECRFDAAAGRVYEEWGWDTHIVPDREPGHYGEVMWMGMDPGILNPTAGLWVEVDRRHGRLVAVAEYQEPGRNAPEHAAAWRALEAKRRPTRVTRRIADPNITKRDQGTSMELSDIYQRLGFSFEKGPVRDDVRIPALANAIASGGLVATESCARLHEQLTEARWEDQLARLRDLGDFREKMKKGNDHLHDCAQYLASIYVQPSARNLPAAPPPPTEQDDIEALWHRERARKLAAQARGHEYDGWAPRDGVLL